MNWLKDKLASSGFTIAEVLIVIGIIGTVANLVLPPLITDVYKKAWEESLSLDLMKIREATNQMKTNGVLDGYSTSDFFVNEFSKYIKIESRCASALLSKCFPSSIKLTSGEEFDTTTLTTGVKLGKATYTSPTVGIGFINGTTAILAFDPNCAPIDPVNNTTDTTACLSMVYDMNGWGKPNQIGKDIALLNATISSCDGKKVGGLCVAASDTTFAPINTCSGGTAADKAFDSSGDSAFFCATNNWAGAKKACSAQGMRMPSLAELMSIYPNRGSIGGFDAKDYWANEQVSVDTGRTWSFATGNQGYVYKERTDAKLRCVK